MFLIKHEDKQKLIVKVHLVTSVTLKKHHDWHIAEVRKLQYLIKSFRNNTKE